jgi:hypothetical protein
MGSSSREAVAVSRRSKSTARSGTRSTTASTTRRTGAWEAQGGKLTRIGRQLRVTGRRTILLKNESRKLHVNRRSETSRIARRHPAGHVIYQLADWVPGVLLQENPRP